MNQKMKAMAIALCLASVFAGVVYATYWLYSSVTPPISVSDYMLTLSAVPNGLEVTLTGSLTYLGNPIASKTVEIYHADADGTLIGSAIATPITQVDGTYSVIVTEVAGTYRYRARVQVP